MAPFKSGAHGGGGGTSRARVERLIFVFLFVVVVARILMVTDLGLEAGKPKPVNSGAVPARVAANAGEGADRTRRRAEEKRASDQGRTERERLTKEREREAQAQAKAEKERAAEEEAAASSVGDRGEGVGADGGGEGAGSWVREEKQPEEESPGAGADLAGPEYAVLDHLKVTDDTTQLVTNKKQFVFFNETEGHSMLRHWLEYEDGNETLIYHFPRSLFELLPLEEPKWKFSTCAIVGNSGITLLKEYGPEIDGHDAVIRINMAPTRGFEPYVGKKTTFDVVNAHNVREILQGVRKWRPATEGDTRLVLFETASHFARYHLCQPLLKKYSQENAILLNPAFSNRAHKLWVELKSLLEQKHDSTYNRKPMSGFFAVLFALQMCDHVDLYGFDAYTSRKRSYRYHYFDNVQGFTDVHSFDLAVEVYKLIAKRGGLSINI